MKVGDAGLAGVADGGVQAAVGHADDDVRLDGMLQSQEGSGPQTGLVDTGAVHHRVGPGEVDKLKDAQAALALVAVAGYYYDVDDIL